MKENVVEYVETKLMSILWISYDFNKIKSRPPEYGRYFIMRKDGQIHWEIWNSTGWAYNEKSIDWWAKIDLPEKKELALNQSLDEIFSLIK